jgi:hypothetical protein
MNRTHHNLKKKKSAKRYLSFFMQPRLTRDAPLLLRITKRYTLYRHVQSFRKFSLQSLKCAGGWRSNPCMIIKQAI